MVEDLAAPPDRTEEGVTVLPPRASVPSCDVDKTTLTQDGTGQEMLRLAALTEKCWATVLLGDAPRGAALVVGLKALEAAGFSYRLEKVVASQFEARVAKVRVVLLACRGWVGWRPNAWKPRPPNCAA